MSNSKKTKKELVAENEVLRAALLRASDVLARQSFDMLYRPWLLRPWKWSWDQEPK
jgi:hypothetical protein